ncbi:SURP and G-patch domain-containing protein 1-like [Ptychodera flava]|uniref:SURP and G-patch domain-containing protein 1-like n=1 Tax=Ptychodera flava TaxID=63121 RepID=UPI00396A5A83
MATRPGNFSNTQMYQKPLSVSDQEKLIEQKKKEIEQKMAEQKKKEEEQKIEDAKTKKPAEIKFQIKSPQTMQPKPEPPKANANVFSNDGSFLEQFKKMQQQMKSKDDNKGEAKTDGKSSDMSTVSGSTEPQLQRKLPFIGKKIGAGSFSSMVSQMKRPTTSAPKTKLSRSDVFDVSDDEEKRDSDKKTEAVSPLEDDDIKPVLEQLAQFVADGGPEVEEIAFERNLNNPAFWFLYEPNSNEYKYYKLKLKEFKLEIEMKKAQSYRRMHREKESGKRKRKSRWSNEEKEEDEDIPAEKIAATMEVNPVGMIGTTVLSADQQRQLREQQEIQRMYESIKAKQAAEASGMSVSMGYGPSSSGRRRKKDPKPKYEYDSDEDIEGGTWEHKKRAEEMQKTHEQAKQMTVANKGKHFIGDFLPKEELEKFMEHVKALKEGGTPDLSDYREYKIKEDNIGYQMLQKAGWKEGEGLGSEGQGIKQPVNKGKTAIDATGLGTDKPGELKEEDDEYDLFRKRMMLAYRFRPNPLNNPRRPYY